MQHSTPGEILNIQSPNGRLPKEVTAALIKTESMEVIRMFLPEGKKVPEHSVPGEITVQCLTGKFDFLVEGQSRIMTPGDWLFLKGGQKHALTAIEESTLLVTILLKQK